MFFFNLKLSWGRLEKEIPNSWGQVHQRFGHSAFTTRTKGIPESQGCHVQWGPAGRRGWFYPKERFYFVPLPSLTSFALWSIPELCRDPGLSPCPSCHHPGHTSQVWCSEAVAIPTHSMKLAAITGVTSAPFGILRAVWERSQGRACPQHHFVLPEHHFVCHGEKQRCIFANRKAYGWRRCCSSLGEQRLRWG